MNVGIEVLSFAKSKLQESFEQTSEPHDEPPKQMTEISLSGQIEEVKRLCKYSTFNDL